MITVRGQILVTRTDDDPLLPVCPFKTSPCVRSKRPRVYRHHAHILKLMCAWCRHTRGRFECTHGGVFESTHGFFSKFFQRAATHTHTHTQTPHTPTTPRPQRHTPHNTTHNITRRPRERQRERQRKKTEKEDRERETEKEGQDKRRRHKTRRQEKMKEERRDKRRREKREETRLRCVSRLIEGTYLAILVRR